MKTRALLGLAAAAVLLVGAGCSDDAPAPAETPAATTAPATPAASGSGSAVATLPVAECLTGDYTLIRFVAIGGSNTYGTGQGGDLKVAFDNGSYTLSGAGEKGVTLTLAGQNAELKVKGTTKGTYVADTGQATFTPGDSTGTATVEAGGQQRELTMAQVAAIVAPKGSAKVACTSEAMTLTFEAVRFELGRV